MVRLVDPTDPAVRAGKALAPPLPSLKGVRVALLDNAKHNADRLLACLGEALEREGARVFPVRKRVYSRPAGEEVLAALAQAEAVVTAIGD